MHDALAKEGRDRYQNIYLTRNIDYFLEMTKDLQVCERVILAILYDLQKRPKILFRYPQSSRTLPKSLRKRKDLKRYQRISYRIIKSTLFQESSYLQLDLFTYYRKENLQNYGATSIRTYERDLSENRRHLIDSLYYSYLRGTADYDYTLTTDDSTTLR